MSATLSPAPASPRIDLRNAGPDDFAAILALNAESVHFTSLLDYARLQHLHVRAAYHRIVEVDGEVAAFLLALREGADYDSPNYRWFAQHCAQFLYIDRIVVAAARHASGLGARLYDDLIAFAASHGVARLACEFDLEPPAAARSRCRCNCVRLRPLRYDSWIQRTEASFPRESICLVRSTIKI